jgi:hypothetical protein
MIEIIARRGNGRRKRGPCISISDKSPFYSMCILLLLCHYMLRIMAAKPTRAICDVWKPQAIYRYLTCRDQIIVVAYLNRHI